MDTIKQLTIMVDKIDAAVKSIVVAIESTPDQNTLAYSNLESILGTLKEEKMYFQQKLIKAYINRDKKERTCKTCAKFIITGAPFKQCLDDFKFHSEDDTCDKWKEQQ